MKKAQFWLLETFPTKLIMRNQRRLTLISIFLFLLAIAYWEFKAEIPVSYPVLILFSLAFISILVLVKLTPLVTQSSALELLSQSPLPCFTYHLEKDALRVRYANPAMQQVSPHKPIELIGKPVSKLSFAEDEEELLSACSLALEGGQQGITHSFYMRGTTQKHEIIKLMCITSELRWLGQSIGICFLFDVSTTEERYAKMNAHVQEGFMGTLVAGIVHDFRNILTSIIGTAEALQFSIDDKNIQNQLEVIIGAGERGSSTITDLLELSSNQQSQEKQEHQDITKSFKNTISLLRLQLPTDIKLLYEVDNNLPFVNIDATRLEQILMNLINNASQAISKKGKILVQVTAEPETTIPYHKGPVLKISVSDNGCGISKENLPHITENFWSLRKDKGGTGLGLAMVKRIVNNHNGKLQITSKLDIGTQINMFFPAKNFDALESKVPEEQSDQQIFEPTKEEPIPLKEVAVQEVRADNPTIPCTILLVDDQADVLHVHRLLLKAMGHRVFTATSGKNALQVLAEEKGRVQLLITDFKMPEMDGIDLAEAVRQLHKKIPLLMVTAYGETDKLNRSKELNMPIILKPSSFKKFADAIAKIQKNRSDIFS